MKYLQFFVFPRFMQYVYLVLLLSSSLFFQSCTQEDSNVKLKEVSLNEYKNRRFFGIIDSTFTLNYPFIHLERNHYQFYTKGSPNFEKLYFDIKQMVRFKDRKLNFYHIGGSHLQADIYTHEMRTLLQPNWKGLPGERGWVFPFDLAKTNNPRNYFINKTY